MANRISDSDLKRPDLNTLKNLADFSVATLYEATSKQGAMDPSIRPVFRGLHLCGPAVTVQTIPGDNLSVHRALSVLSAGDVLVVSCGGCVTTSIWGEIMTVAALQRRAVGLVTDGAVRDTKQIIAKGFPVFARGVTVAASSKQHNGSINAPVLCGGVLVRPGDIIIGDDDGLVVIPSNQVESAIQAARQREEREREIIQMIEQGKTTIEIYGFH